MSQFITSFVVYTNILFFNLLPTYTCQRSLPLFSTVQFIQLTRDLELPPCGAGWCARHGEWETKYGLSLLGARSGGRMLVKQTVWKCCGTGTPRVPWGIRKKRNSPSCSESAKAPWSTVLWLELEQGKEQHGRVWGGPVVPGTVYDWVGLKAETRRVQTRSVARDEILKNLMSCRQALNFFPEDSEEPLKNFKQILSDLCFWMFSFLCFLSSHFFKYCRTHSDSFPCL